MYHNVTAVMYPSDPSESRVPDTEETESVSGKLYVPAFNGSVQSQLSREHVVGVALHPQTNSRCAIKGRAALRDGQYAADGLRVGMKLPANQGSGTAKQQDQAKRWCLWLGMTTAAWDGWGRIHVKPRVAAC